MAKRTISLDGTAQHKAPYRFRGNFSPEDFEHVGIGSEATATRSGDTAVNRINDVIDSYGGYSGSSANKVIGALEELGDVDTAQVRINFASGDAFEGITIYNALVNHPATIKLYVGALAASAASVVAMPGDTIMMALGSQRMIRGRKPTARQIRAKKYSKKDACA